MDRPKMVRPLALAAPLALGTVLAAAPQASAGISDAVLSSPHVLDNGKTLNVTFSSAITDAITDNTIARNAASAVVGNWVGDLLDYAVRNTPTRTSTCRVTTTATDPNGAKGTTSAVIPVGVTKMALNIPDQAPGTKWAVGDRDHFAVTLVCTDDQSAAQVSELTIDQDEIVA